MKSAVLLRSTLFASLSLFAIEGHTTTGYFMHGYGIKTQGNAGASIANFNDALTIANNPAGLSDLPNQINVGVTLFNPQRKAEIVGNQTPNGSADGRFDGNGREWFAIPELAVNKKINEQISLGLAIYGNGGMNTGYQNNPFAAFGNQGEAGVDLSQLFVAPAIAWQYAPNQSIGLTTRFAYQQFEAKGVNGFAPFSQDGSKLSNNGKDSSTGFGFGIGWAGTFAENLTLGLNYSSKTKMSAFDDYRGLFAESGDFDIPESYSLGIAYQATPQLKLVADIQRINYSEVKSVGNGFDINSLMAGNPFGSANGQGFGWQDINVYKFGATYQANPQLTLRAGYSYNEQPIQANQTFLNILAPGVIQHHASLGATWHIDPTQEVSVAYTHAFRQDVKGKQSIPAQFGGGEANLNMYQNILGIAYQYNF